MNRRNIATTALLLATLAVNSCGHKSASTTAKSLPIVTVQTQVAEYKNRIATEDDIGTVRAKLHAAIEAKVSGKIEQMLVVPGQDVTNGELLATIDAREVQAQYDQSLALRQQAESDLNRATNLFGQNILSPSEYDSAQSKFRVADAAAAAAKTLLDYTKVTAPFAGVVTRKDADVGDLAAPGKPLLEMEDPQHLRLEADVPEALVGNVKLGDKLAVRVDALKTNLIGVVSEIAPSADPDSRTFVVKLDLPSAPGLRTGQFGRVAIPTGEVSALRVPASAVIQRGDMQLLFIVAASRQSAADPSKPDLRRSTETPLHAQLRIVKTGARVGDEVEIVSGLNAGEQVVTSGVNDLTDGQPVVVKP